MDLIFVTIFGKYSIYQPAVYNAFLPRKQEIILKPN